MVNSEVHQHYLKINQITDEVKRPLWSVLIPTHNCAHYLRETLQSVLAQDPGEALMEIIVVDDHSTKDDPEAVVKEFGQGRVQFIRQEKNVGKVKNYETGLTASRVDISINYMEMILCMMVFTKKWKLFLKKALLQELPFLEPTT